ncbi:glycosyltransferase family 2 protein [Euzebya tangerina]|uniref:glycosyltransferase family 2 protein n=1 Tax=Euzebya tangerina TaxID=591198 RepID=UPI000E319566|nr:glycosyltransferase [Euzebya tangerina]
MSGQGVTAVVAAYNEASRIGTVLDVLTGYDGFTEVVVVDDGSTDDTASVAAAHGATCLTVTPNRGKGHAMDVGVQHAPTDVIFFADADIIGLTHEMITATTQPVMDGTCDMFILMRNHKIFLLRAVLSFIPLLGGERAVTKRLWNDVPERFKDRFRIEAGLNFYAIHYGHGLQYRVFPGVTQTVKELKFGIREGLRRRLAMSTEVAAAVWDLQHNELPPTRISHRRAAMQIVLSTVGMLIGVLVVSSAIAEPVPFFQTVFAGELQEDPGAALPSAILGIAATLGGGALLSIGVAIATLNLAVFVAGLVRIVAAGQARLRG